MARGKVYARLKKGHKRYKAHDKREIQQRQHDRVKVTKQVAFGLAVVYGYTRKVGSFF